MTAPLFHDHADIMRNVAEDKLQLNCLSVETERLKRAYIELRKEVDDITCEIRMYIPEMYMQSHGVSLKVLFLMLLKHLDMEVQYQPEGVQFVSKSKGKVKNG